MIIFLRPHYFKHYVRVFPYIEFNFFLHKLLLKWKQKIEDENNTSDLFAMYTNALIEMSRSYSK